MNLATIHGGLAALTGAGAVALLVASGLAYFQRSAAAVNLVVLVRRLAIVAAVLAALAGAALFATGHRPQEGLHYLYGFLAVATIPVAASLASRNPRTGALYHLVAGLLLLGFCFRLLSTG